MFETTKFLKGELRSATGIALVSIALCSGSVALAQDGFGQELRQDLRDTLPEDILESNTIVAAGAFDNPPALYADVTDTRRALGVAPDLSHAIGEILGVEFEWRNTQWPGQLPGLDSGTFDVVWGQITQTAERERELLDLVPWSQNTLGFLVEEGNPEGITDWESACGHRIAVSLGSIFVDLLGRVSEDVCAPQDLEPIVIREYQGHEVTGIQSGQADAAMDIYSVLDGMAEGMGGFEAIEIPAEVAREYYAGFSGVATSKENPELALAIAEALRILHENGTWQMIADSHNAGNEVPMLADVRVNPLSDTPAGEFATE